MSTHIFKSVEHNISNLAFGKCPYCYLKLKKEVSMHNSGDKMVICPGKNCGLRTRQSVVDEVLKKSALPVDKPVNK